MHMLTYSQTEPTRCIHFRLHQAGIVGFILYRKIEYFPHEAVLG